MVEVYVGLLVVLCLGVVGVAGWVLVWVMRTYSANMSANADVARLAADYAAVLDQRVESRVMILNERLSKAVQSSEPVAKPASDYAPEPAMTRLSEEAELAREMTSQDGLAWSP
jgi:hypothetical protein